MPNLGKIHVGDKNTEIILTVQDTQTNDTNIALDLQANTPTEMLIRVFDPDGVEKTALTASIKNAPGTDGKITGTNTDAAFFDQKGSWEFKAKVTLASGGIYTSNPHVEEVLG
jgi:hypothetical protein